MKHQPSQSGVRLSFALSAWQRLAEKYPKAKTALIDLRDKNTKEFEQGNGSFGLFQETAAINRELDQETRTVELFKSVHESSPRIAKRRILVTEPILVAHREYELCGAYIDDGLKRFDRIKEMRELQQKIPAAQSQRFKAFVEDHFMDETCRVIDILVNVGRNEEAKEVYDAALAVRNDRQFQRALDKVFPAPRAN